MLSGVETSLEKVLRLARTRPYERTERGRRQSVRGYTSNPHPFDDADSTLAEEDARDRGWISQPDWLKGQQIWKQHGAAARDESILAEEDARDRGAAPGGKMQDLLLKGLHHEISHPEEWEPLGSGSESEIRKMIGKHQGYLPELYEFQASMENARAGGKAVHREETRAYQIASQGVDMLGQRKYKVSVHKHHGFARGLEAVLGLAVARVKSYQRQENGKTQTVSQYAQNRAAGKGSGVTKQPTMGNVRLGKPFNEQWQDIAVGDVLQFTDGLWRVIPATSYPGYKPPTSSGVSTGVGSGSSTGGSTTGVSTGVNTGSTSSTGTGNTQNTFTNYLQNFNNPKSYFTLTLPGNTVVTVVPQLP